MLSGKRRLDRTRRGVSGLLWGLIFVGAPVSHAEASSTAIDFEAVGADVCLYYVGETVETQGYSFSEPIPGLSLFTCNGSHEGGYYPANGSRSLVAQSVTMTQVGGGAFDVRSFDLAQEVYGFGSSSFIVDLVVRGTRSDGTHPVAHFSTLGSTGFSQMDLGTDFSDLTSIEFFDTHADLPQVFFLDNILATTVPEPGTALIFACGLAILSRYRVSPAIGDAEMR